MRNAITPVVSIILLLVMTVAASAAAFLWMNSVQSSIQESAGASIESSTVSSCSRLNLISMRGDEVVVQNVGCDNITSVNLLINGVLTGYDLEAPLAPGEAAKIDYTAQTLGEDLDVIIVLGNGASVTASIQDCQFADGCDNLEEKFEDHVLGADVADGSGWTNVGDQDSEANATIVNYMGDHAALFLDNSVTKIADKTYTLSQPSLEFENTTVEFNIDFSNEGMGSRTFVIIFYDDVNNIIQFFVLGNGFMAVIESPSIFREFWSEPGGNGYRIRWTEPITYEGNHDYTIVFDEVAETIRYYIDGEEIYANDGLGGTFDDYYQTAGPIAKLEFATGSPIALGGTGSEINTVAYLDDINFNWIQ
ncbi:MAG: hypothetical protein JW791_03125 [Nanoarchaeota archaeon]|nr:hypothetical protein [Nanoarchaeota archaeon]